MAAGAAATKFAAFKIIGSVAGIALAVTAAAVVVNKINTPKEDIDITKSTVSAETSDVVLTTTQTTYDLTPGSDGLLYEAYADGKTCKVSIGTCTDDHVIIPQVSPDGLVVTHMDDFDNAVMTSVDIPDTVTTINGWGFDNCVNLESLVIPDSVVEIQGGGPGSGRHFLAGCDNFKYIEFGSGLDRIPLMGEFDSLESVVIHDGVTFIPALTFSYCPNLRSVELPNTLERIDTSAFRDSTSLDGIVLPESLEKIDQNAFYNTGISSIEIPASVTEIGAFAFQDCINLETISVPATVTTIGVAAFEGCTSLTTVDYYASSVPMSAFSNCSSLTSVTLHEGVEEICKYAFQHTRISELTIPATVTAIESEVTGSNVQVYITQASLDSADRHAFSQFNDNVTVIG